MKKVIALACDGEFTNFDKMGGDLISWAFVEILEDFTVGQSKLWKIRGTSSKYWSKEAEEVHGISYWQASSFPPRRQQLISIMNWVHPLIDSFPLQLIYHGNANLDPEWLRMTFFKEEIEDSFHKAFIHKGISTLSLARKNLKHIPESTKINPLKGKLYTRYSLMNICDFYGIEIDHHKADSDAHACAQIYCKIMREENTWTGRLF